MRISTFFKNGLKIYILYRNIPKSAVRVVEISNNKCDDKKRNK